MTCLGCNQASTDGSSARAGAGCVTVAPAAGPPGVMHRAARRVGHRRAPLPLLPLQLRARCARCGAARGVAAMSSCRLCAGLPRPRGMCEVLGSAGAGVASSSCAAGVAVVLLSSGVGAQCGPGYARAASSRAADCLSGGCCPTGSQGRYTRRAALAAGSTPSAPAPCSGAAGLAPLLPTGAAAPAAPLRLAPPAASRAPPGGAGSDRRPVRRKRVPHAARGVGSEACRKAGETACAAALPGPRASTPAPVPPRQHPRASTRDLQESHGWRG